LFWSLKHFARDRFDNLAARVLRRAKHETLLADHEKVWRSQSRHANAAAGLFPSSWG
jgi:hypothetical protein